MSSFTNCHIHIEHIAPYLKPKASHDHTDYHRTSRPQKYIIKLVLSQISLLAMLKQKFWASGLWIKKCKHNKQDFPASIHYQQWVRFTPTTSSPVKPAPASKIWDTTKINATGVKFSLDTLVSCVYFMFNNFINLIRPVQSFQHSQQIAPALTKHLTTGEAYHSLH